MSEPTPNFTGRVHARQMMLLDSQKPMHTKETAKRLFQYLQDKKMILMVVFLCSFTSTVITIMATRLNGYVIDHMIATKDISRLAFFCAMMAGMYCINAMTTYAQNVLMVKVAQQVYAQIRHDLFHKLQKLSLSFFDTHSSGDIMSRLTNDVDNINNALAQGAVQIFTSIVMIIGMLIAMLLLNPFLTMICMITLPLTFFISRVIMKAAHRFFQVQQVKLGSLNGFSEEMISGQKAVKLFHQEAEVCKTFDKLNDEMSQAMFHAQCFSNSMGPCNNMINNLSYLIIAMIGGIYVIFEPQTISVGIVFTFLLYMRNFTNPINNILNLINLVQLAFISAQRVFDVIDEEEEKDEDTLTSHKIIGDIEMKHVDFSYIKGKQILKDASLYAHKGERIAIVGPTGAGKTTIINLLTRFYDIDNGEILIDNIPIKHYSREALRSSISMVLQDTYLFSDTIRENIRYGRIDASDEEVIEAAKKAHAHDFIMQLSDGYDTVLLDNGQNLSQGQRQLLSIARAVLSQASILILDEATSSVDTRTEQSIQKAMMKLMEGKTCFVIAHRLSTIQDANQILVIVDGQIVEKGTHDSLIAKCGVYKNLYDSQYKNIK